MIFLQTKPLPHLSKFAEGLFSLGFLLLLLGALYFAFKYFNKSKNQ